MANPLRTQKARGVLNVIFSVGAAIIIFGALAKIEHWGGAWGNALIIGMISESLTFLLMAFLPAEEVYHWEKYYPHLNLTPEEEKKLTGKYEPKNIALGSGAAAPSPVAGMDKMLEEADITPTNLKKLSDNFQKLNQTVGQMKDFSGTVAAADDFSQKTKGAAEAMGNISTAYNNVAETMNVFNETAANSQEFHTEMEKMAKNLGSLNAIYELEVENADSHQKNMKKFYGSISDISEAMSGGVEDAYKTKEQIALMAKNMENLNNVYGNMLSAMNNH